MKIKNISVLAICICCFLLNLNAQTPLDGAALQKKVQTALKESPSVRMGYSSSKRNIYVDFEKDAKANTHLLVRNTGKKYLSQTVIDMAGKSFYAKTDAAFNGEAPLWMDKMPTNFNKNAWMDTCNNATKILNKPFSKCTFVKESKITAVPFSAYSVVIEKDTFKILLNKKLDRIESIESENRSQDISYSWEFYTPFTISAPPTDLTDKPNFGFSVFPPMYSRNDDFDGTEPVYVVVDKLPEFIGGIKEMFKFMGQNIKYPEAARENGIEGTVYIGFVVEKDGSMTNFVLKRGIGAGCNEEAMRVLKAMNGKWESGFYGGQKVRVAYTLPIKFKLE
jgi:TonB family protein